MANKSNNVSRGKKHNPIPPMGNNKNRGALYQQPVFDKRRKDNAKVKY